jgi:hypothetical protein
MAGIGSKGSRTDYSMGLSNKIMNERTGLEDQVGFIYGRKKGIRSRSVCCVIAFFSDQTLCYAMLC